MHRVKVQARKEAWDPESPYTDFNPFRRRIPHRGSAPHLRTSNNSDQFQDQFTLDNLTHFGTAPPPKNDDNVESPHNNDDNVEVASNNDVDVETVSSKKRPILRRCLSKVVFLLKFSVYSSWLNLLLSPFIPIGFAVRYSGQSSVLVFTINFLAILPLALTLGKASDELISRTGDILGALINCTFSNAVQLITSILLLKDRQIILLQISLVGSILSNMHLAVGLGFFLGGINRKEQYYNAHMAQVLGTGLLLSVAALIIPTVIKQFPSAKPDEGRILSISRSIAIILLLCYVGFLYYSLYTHLDDFRAPSQKVPLSQNVPLMKRALHKGSAMQAAVTGSLVASKAAVPVTSEVKICESVEEEDKQRPRLDMWSAIALTVITTTLLAFNTAFATDSLNGLIESTGLNNTFIGIVLLPLLSVDFTMFPLAMKDKMDLFLSLTVGKCLQTSLLVIPILILLGWILDISVGLDLDPFEAIALYASIIYINNMIQVGKSTYFQGILLLGLFIIISVVSFYLPTELP